MSNNFKLRKPMRKEFEEFGNPNDLIYILEYKEERFPIFNDDYGCQCYTVIDGKTYSGGAFNTDYIEDFKYLILSREEDQE